MAVVFQEGRSLDQFPTTQADTTSKAQLRALEDEVGVRLLSRTTRSMALTEAGEQLLRRLRPALREVDETLQEISGARDKAARRIRLLIPRLAVTSVLAPRLGKLYRQYPDIILDVTADDSRRDIVAEGFDAGIHFGEYIEKDMTAVPSRRTRERQLWALPHTLTLIRGPKHPVIFSHIGVSSSGMVRRACTDGNSKKERSLFR